MRPVPPQFAGPVKGSSDFAGGAQSAAWASVEAVRRRVVEWGEAVEAVETVE